MEPARLLVPGVRQRATLYCEAPEAPGVMTAQTPSGPVVPVCTTLAQLAAARGPAAWFSTTGQDLLPQLPDGHDVLVDPAGPSPLLLRRGLWTGSSCDQPLAAGAARSAPRG